MPIAQSRVTAQGQISVPAEVRKQLGVGPGSVLEWTQEGNRIVVRRAGRYGWDEVRKVLFADQTPRARTLEELKAGPRLQARRKYARD
jgi:antitoxin PrlF